MTTSARVLSVFGVAPSLLVFGYCGLLLLFTPGLGNKALGVLCLSAPVAQLVAAQTGRRRLEVVSGVAIAGLCVELARSLDLSGVALFCFGALAFSWTIRAWHTAAGRVKHELASRSGP